MRKSTYLLVIGLLACVCATVLLIGGITCLLNDMLVCSIIMIILSSLLYVVLGYVAKEYFAEKSLERERKKVECAIEEFNNILKAEIEKRENEPFEEFNK